MSILQRSSVELVPENPRPSLGFEDPYDHDADNLSAVGFNVESDLSSHIDSDLDLDQDLDEDEDDIIDIDDEEDDVDLDEDEEEDDDDFYATGSLPPHDSDPNYYDEDEDELFVPPHSDLPLSPSISLGVALNFLDPDASSLRSFRGGFPPDIQDLLDFDFSHVADLEAALMEEVEVGLVNQNPFIGRDRLSSSPPRPLRHPARRHTLNRGLNRTLNLNHNHNHEYEDEHNDSNTGNLDYNPNFTRTLNPPQPRPGTSSTTTSTSRRHDPTTHPSNHTNSSNLYTQRNRAGLRVFLSSDDEGASLDDELIGMEFDGPPPAARRNPGDHGQPESRPHSAADDVIDLTNEPDSPVQAHSRPPASLNPRRQNSQAARNPPTFARSDSSILGGPAVIDLTDDGPDPPRSRPARTAPQGQDVNPDLIFINQRPAPGARNRGPRLPPPPAPAHRHVGLPIGPPRRRTREQNAQGGGPGMGMFAGLRRGIPNRWSFFGLLRHADDEDLANMMPDFNPIGEINLEYHNGAFDQAAQRQSPKPTHETPDAARAGFTRDAQEDQAVVCPACGEELAYEPVESSTANVQAPTRAASKGKRARSEHHFWALKNCGHVYCEECFEGRRPTAKRRNTGFRADKDSKPVCAVEGCDTQVSGKTAWVGLYM